MNNTVLDLFCGCGGFSLGFQKAGFKVKYAIDNSNLVKKTYEYNHPNTEFVLEDIHNLNPIDFRDVDIVIGSPPCQDFSRASNNPNQDEGLELVREFLKWVSTIKPKYWIMENVPLVKEHLKRNINNFNIPRILVLNSANYGVPQKRKRCFAGRYPKPTPTHNKLGGRDLFGNNLKKWETVWNTIKDIIQIDPLDNKESKIKNHICFDNCKHINFDTANREIDLNLPSPTIDTKWRSTHKIPYYKKEHTLIYPPEQELSFRRVSIRECARLQSFPDNFIFFGSKTAQYTMIGNAVPPLMSYAFGKKIKENT